MERHPDSQTRSEWNAGLLERRSVVVKLTRLGMERQPFLIVTVVVIP